VIRLFRILRAALLLISFILCLVIVVFWIRSYFVTDDFQRIASHDVLTQLRWNQDHLMIGKGGIGVCRTAWSAPAGSAPVWGHTPFVRDSSIRHQRLPPTYPQFVFPPTLPQLPLGFNFEQVDVLSPGNPAIGKYRGMILPFWSLLIFFLLLALPESVHRYRKFRRRKEGLCPHCGYDLRASSDLCPECGQRPKPALINEPSSSPAC
jgi:hypothetical protein